MWSLIFSFLKALLTGEVVRLWRQHKLNEARQAQNEVEAESGEQVQKEINEWRRG